MFCRYVVYCESPEIDLFANVHYKWCMNSTQGKWAIVFTDYIDSSKSKFFFELKEDATHFKLVWV